MKKTSYTATLCMIAALYCAATLLMNIALPVFSWGPVQIRISESLCVLAVLTPAAVPGLTIGCALANLFNCAISGTGIMGLFDVAFGTLATFLGAFICSKCRRRQYLAIGSFVLTNALIVPAYLPLMLQGLGFYTIPFTDINLDGAYIFMYLFGVCAIAISEAFSIYVIGVPILKLMKKRSRAHIASDEED